MEGGPPIFRQDFTCPALLEDTTRGFPYGAVTRCGAPFQTLPVPVDRAAGLIRVRSPLLAESRLMSVPPATEMFQFAGFASCAYGFSAGYPQELPLAGGLPHSDTPGSKIARISPGLFAACRVLHRLSVPRHPPDALQLRLIRARHPEQTGYRTTPPTHSGQPHRQRRFGRAMPERPRMKTLLRTRHPATPDPRGHTLIGQHPSSRQQRPRQARLGHITNSRLTRQSTYPARPPKRDVGNGDLMDFSEPRSRPLETAAQRAPWWRRPGSNRRPPACKAGALPAELRPLYRDQKTGIRDQASEILIPDPCLPIPEWWAREDLNLRPHAYQARALTS